MSRPKRPTPQYGLVCITACDEVRYRLITRTRYLSLDDKRKKEVLQELYESNVRTIETALRFCDRNNIRLYRLTSNLFPMADESIGQSVLRQLKSPLAAAGKLAESFGIRVTMHPDQFVVLSSDSPSVIATGIVILKKHALTMDLLGLPRSPWAALTIHGGKGDRADRLIDVIKSLPVAIRSRLMLENDEYAYGAAEILAVCQRAKVPMIFDCHHHAVYEGLTDYDDPSFEAYVDAARQTWPKPDWQLCHLSNGKEAFGDPRHSELITHVPTAFDKVPWIDVEARGKECAIRELRETR
jgi:UV DNA damage endonuclease